MQNGLQEEVRARKMKVMSKPGKMEYNKNNICI